MYHLDGILIQKIMARNGEANDLFGWSVATAIDVRGNL